MYITHIHTHLHTYVHLLPHPVFLALSQGFRIMRAGANFAIEKWERPDNRQEIIRTAPSGQHEHTTSISPHLPLSWGGGQQSYSPPACCQYPWPASSRPKAESVPSSAGWQQSNGLNKDQVAESRSHNLDSLLLENGPNRAQNNHMIMKNSCQVWIMSNYEYFSKPYSFSWYINKYKLKNLQLTDSMATYTS